jgi:hypothetical protein
MKSAETLMFVGKFLAAIAILASLVFALYLRRGKQVTTQYAIR